VIAIGGITPDRAATLSSYGVAAISAIVADPVEATTAFLKALP
jgi:thiamine monophosphate synthase